MNPPHSWQLNKGDDYYYVRLENAEVIFGNLFEGGRSGLEWTCPFDVFLHEDHEIKTRISEVFGDSVIEEVKQEILRLYENFSKKL